jgi:predicted ATPase
VLRYSSASRSLDVVSESLEPLTKDGHAHRSVVPYIKVESPGRRLSVKLERQAHPRFYDLPRNRTLLAEVGDSVNHPHLVAVARELRSLRVYYVEPVRMRSAIADVEATDPGPHGEQLAAFYYWLQRRHPVVFRNLLHNLRRLVPSVRDLGVREGSEGFLELWVSEGDSREFPAALVSEGTLRLLSLLGIAATPQAPAIAGYEEPENGVNPARLEEMLRILANASAGPSGIQLFLTTHSPEVVNFFGDATRVLCSRRKGESVYEPMDNAPLFVSSLVQDALGGLSVRSAPLGERLRRGDLE